MQESRNLGVPAMVLTMGSQGSVYVDHRSGEFGRCPAQSVDMVDSTGAGDAFFSGTVAALMKRMPLSQAVRVGTGSCVIRDGSVVLRVQTLSIRGSLWGLF